MPQMLKLSDFCDFENDQKGVAVLRTVKNSIKRNIVLPSTKLKHSEASQQYQSKLTGHNFRPKDLRLLFEHLYGKIMMCPSDRNLLRRILLSLFPEQLICSAGRSMIEISKFKSFNDRCRIQGDDKFYLILTGRIKVKTPYYENNFTDGSYVGQWELMCQVPANHVQLTVEPGTCILYFTKKQFEQHFQNYFKDQCSAKRKSIPQPIESNLQLVQEYLLCEQMEKITFAAASKIKKKGDPLTEVIFFSQGRIDHFEEDIILCKQKMNCENTLGLAEVVLGKKFYTENIFASEEVKGYSINTETLLKFIPLSTLAEMQSTMKSSLVELQVEPLSPKQVKLEPLANFMRVRKVKLSYAKSLKTSPSEIAETQTIDSTIKRSRMRFLNPQNYLAEFVFVKPDRIFSHSTFDKSAKRRLNKSEIMLSCDHEAGNMPRLDFNKYQPSSCH